MEIVEREDTLLTLTEAAAAKIRELMAEEPEGEAEVLRVAIQGGGCSGFQYGLGFDDGPVDDDVVEEQHGVTVVIDPVALGGRGARLGHGLRAECGLASGLVTVRAGRLDEVGRARRARCPASKGAVVGAAPDDVVRVDGEGRAPRLRLVLAAAARDQQRRRGQGKDAEVQVS